MPTFVYEILVKENELKMTVGFSTGSDPTWIMHSAEGPSLCGFNSTRRQLSVSCLFSRTV